MQSIMNNQSKDFSGEDSMMSHCVMLASGSAPNNLVEVLGYT
jgi:hypothetical protein